jgi:hypothetical protein
VRRGNIFKLTIGNYSLHQDSKDNGVRIVNFATSKNLMVKKTMFPHRDLHNYTWIFSDGKIHNQIDQILIEMRWQPNILDVLSFRRADCDTDHYLVVEIDRGKLAVTKQAAQKFDRERYNLRKLNVLEIRKQNHIEITNRFSALGIVTL